uniref:Uncharacterized protein n=1 Tax=Solanum lycopersicum TaxID=4081 RepID=A0A3Q7F430_SOLLC
MERATSSSILFQQMLLYTLTKSACKLRKSHSSINGGVRDALSRTGTFDSIGVVVYSFVGVTTGRFGSREDIVGSVVGVFSDVES